MGVNILVRCRIYPTEDVSKIKNAILYVFPDCKFRNEEEEIICESHIIDNFAKILREERIRDAARSYFLSHIRDNTLDISLNKQALVAEKISFSVGDVPLGDIKVRITSDDINSLVDDIAPNTKHL